MARAAFSSEGEGQDGESSADALTSEPSEKDSAAEGADAAVDAATEPASDAPSTSGDARAGDADGEVAPGVRFTGDKYDSIELSAETPDGENVKMTAVRPLIPADESLMEKDGWLYDMTEQGHTVHNNPNIRNAHLSDRTKARMSVMHLRDPKTWDVARLAEQYKIRQQRVMAILALKKLQQQHLKPRQRHVPAPRGGVGGDPRERGPRARASDTCASSPSSRVELPGRAREHVPGGARRADLPRYESPEAKAEKEERVLIRRFRDNLAYNMREHGELNRRGRIGGRTRGPPAAGV